MTIVYGLIALALVSLLYFFVSVGGALWPGGPQLQPEAARNLSISLVIVGLLLCGLIFGNLGELIAPSGPLEIGGGVGPGDEIDGTLTAMTETASAGAAIGGGTQIAAATPDQSDETPPGATTPMPPMVVGTPEQALTVSPSPTQPIVTETSTVTPTPTPIPTALPLDPRELVETVLRGVIERANDAEVDAILSGDETDVDPWWGGQARDRVLENVRRVRGRFLAVTDVTWRTSGDGIQLLSGTVTTATYTTSETWTFVGTVNRECPDGSRMSQRYVETYPSEQYMLVLRDSIYSVIEWQLGPAIVEESSPVCP